MDLMKFRGLEGDGDGQSIYRSIRCLSTVDATRDIGVAIMCRLQNPIPGNIFVLELHTY